MEVNNNIAILIYTHDEYSFLWKAMFSLCEKYIKDVDIHIIYNDDADKTKVNTLIPSNFIHHTYSTSLIWTKRVLKGLKEMSEDYVLFLHEDWLPIGDVKLSVLKDMISYMKTIDCGFLLSYSHISRTSVQPGVFTGYDNYYYYKEDNHIFQPAIWNKSVFEEFCGVLDKRKNQNEDSDCLNFMSRKNCWSVQNRDTVTSLRTTNSLLFPHMHAMSEGLWNFTKYPTLKTLLNSYGVETDSRGIHSWWELDTQ